MQQKNNLNLSHLKHNSKLSFCLRKKDFFVSFNYNWNWFVENGEISENQEVGSRNNVSRAIRNAMRRSFQPLQTLSTMQAHFFTIYLYGILKINNYPLPSKI